LDSVSRDGHGVCIVPHTRVEIGRRHRALTALEMRRSSMRLLGERPDIRTHLLAGPRADAIATHPAVVTVAAEAEPASPMP
jgi:hypothetical protein